jgi:hypothetical protein
MAADLDSIGKMINRLTPNTSSSRRISIKFAGIPPNVALS